MNDPFLATQDGDGDGVGSILLADSMLQLDKTAPDSALEHTAENIISGAAQFSKLPGAFNLFAIGALLGDGRNGKFNPDVWAQIEPDVATMVAKNTETVSGGCLPVSTCYNNWRLVWSLGATSYLASGMLGQEGSGVSNAGQIRATVANNLSMATTHAGKLLASNIGGEAAELSDTRSEPVSYHTLSTTLLDMLGTQTPLAANTRIKKLMRLADRFSLDLMAPDGQMSMSGRSLDLSWVQAAAADLGARRAKEDPAHAPQWRSFADRAMSYLLDKYTVRPDGIVPIAPGLASNNWDQGILDYYAHENQYAGFTSWFLADALAHWPSATAARANIPADKRGLLVNDAHTSGQVWGRGGNVWWNLYARDTSADLRQEQGVVDVKVSTPGGWQDLLALRPEFSPYSSAWYLQAPNGSRARPAFLRVHGDGEHAVLNGNFRDAHSTPTTWDLRVIKNGIRLAMSKPPRDKLVSTLWLPDDQVALSAPNSHIVRQAPIVTASGNTYPVTIEWGRGKQATLSLTEK